MRARVPALLLLSLAGCASVQSVVEVTGSPGAPGRGPLPIYYAVAPPFPTHEVGVIDTYGQGNGAHLDELLTDAETRARALGADALLPRPRRGHARGCKRDAPTRLASPTLDTARNLRCKCAPLHCSTAAHPPPCQARP